jgi:hypothetical protein
MQTGFWKRWRTLALVVFLVAGTGCADQGGKNQPGVDVLFDGRPHISHEAVYYNGKAVGKIGSTEVRGTTVCRLTIIIAPEFKNQIGGNWAFYVDGGRLIAVRLNNSLAPPAEGAKLCGFNTKGDFAWFKFKTLLSDRVYHAIKRADALFRRFENS